MALDTAARDQPVAAVIGCRNTASDIIAPTATQPISPPTATMTHPYRSFIAVSLQALSWSSRSGTDQIDIAGVALRGHLAQPVDPPQAREELRPEGDNG